MTRRMVFVLWVVGVLLPLLAGCGEHPSSEGAGELSMELRTVVNGVAYRLRDGVFQVTGPAAATLNTEDNPDAASIDIALPVGNYSINLQAGWRLEKEFADGFHTVSAMLVSVNPRDFSISSSSTTNVAYGFLTDGVIVGFGQGNLNLTIEVTDTSNTAGVALVGGLDGRLLQFPCADNPATDDCFMGGAIVDGANVACVGGQLNLTVDHGIGGVVGATYLATLHFYGVVEPKNYGNNDRRESGVIRPMNVNTGATPPPWYVGVPGQGFIMSLFSSYEIRVFDAVGTEVGTYFLNSDTLEGHFSYVLNFERTIPIIGGGTVRIRVFDANCREIKNCGATAGFPCAFKARTVDISAADPPPPMGAPPLGFTQPGLGQSPDHAGQWLLIDVTNVVSP